MALNLDKIDLGGFGINKTEQPQEDVQVRANMNEAVKINPDQYANITKLSKETGVPEFAVESDPAKVEEGLKLDNIDFTEMSVRNPNTEKYLTNFNNSVIAQDDIDVLKSIEDAVNVTKKYGSDIVKSFKKGNLMVESSEIGLGGMYASIGAGEALSNEQIERQKEIDKILKSPVDEYGFIMGILPTAAEQIPIMAEILLNSAEYGGYGAAAGAGVSLLTGGKVPLGRAAKFGGKLGLRVGVAKGAFDLEAGLAFNEFSTLKDEKGNILNPEISGYAAFTVGGINAALEFLSFRALGKTITPAVKAVIRSRVKKAIATESGRQMITRLGKNYAKYIATESVTEGLQELTNIIGGEVAKNIDEESFTDQDVSKVLDNIFSEKTMSRVAKAAEKGAQASIAFGAPGTVVSVVAETKERNNLAENEQARINELNNLSQSSKLRERDKESFKQFVEQADGDNNTTVFVDAAQTSLYLQSKTRDEIEADPALKLLDEQVREASQLGTDIQIPIAEFTGEITGTDHYTQLRDSMTMSESTPSPFRQDQIQKETETYVKTLIDEAQENTSQYVEAQEIYETVRDQLVDSGTVTTANASIMAQIVPAWATAQATRQGKTVQQVYQESGLTIEGPQTGEKARLQGEQVFEQPSFKDAPVIFDQVRDQFLNVLPEDATVEDVNDVITEFGPEYQNFIKALERDDWLGFDSPAQAIETVLSEEVENYELSQGLKSAIGRMVNLELSTGDITTPKELLKQSPTETMNADEVLELSTDVPRLSKKANDALTESIKKDGVTKPVIMLKNKDGSTTLEDGHHRARIAKELGIDVPVTTIEQGKDETDIQVAARVLDAVEGTTFEQSNVDDKNLFVAHNLSAENLIHAAKVGGLAVPSLAIAKTDTGFEGFGEVSLLADKALLQDPAAKTFGADIYSPRYPSINYKIDIKEYNNVIEPINENLESLGIDIVRSDIESQGIQELYYDKGIRYTYLKSIDKAPKLRYEKKEKLPKVFNKFTSTDQHNISREHSFKKAAGDYYSKKAVNSARNMSEAGKEGDYDFWLKDWNDTYFNEEGEVRLRFIDELAHTVSRLNRPRRVDGYELDSQLAKKIKTPKVEGEFKSWIEATFSDVISEERIFTGYTPSGNRKYIAHNLDNIVKVMKKELRGGENFNYGVGTIRSGIAPQFKTIKQIQNARGKLTEKVTMDSLKEETSNEFSELVELMRPYYKYDGDGFGYLDAASENLYDMARGKGLQDYENLPDDIRIEAAEFLAKLRDMPTEYFESKVQRAVGIEEFDTAIVPRGMRKDAIKVLEDAGLKIKTYDPKTKGSRVATIAKQKQLLFQKPTKTKEARGYYDPANSIIRLTESSDLSTFLHEFAHFMYEMEIKNDSDMVQSINNWYKRNSDDVAKEANSYLGNKADVLIQGDKPTIKEGSIAPDDVTTFLDNNTTGNKDKDSAIRRAVHEQFARGFETYLMEGKAPSIELRNAFRAFARWLSRIYQTLKGQLNVKVDEEMTQVFDRLIATEEQIQAAQARARIEPMFTSAAMAGMTEEEFADYQTRQEKVKDVQSETLRDKIIKQLTRKTKSWWKEQKQDIIDEQIDELNKEKIYVTRNRLKDGDIKLDHATVKEMIGEEKTNKLGKKSTIIPPVLRGMTAKGQQGIHPDEAAAFFGYSSGSEMLNDLVTAPAIKDKAEVNAEMIMIERHGDIMNDGTIEREADEAVQNEERGELILRELKILAKGTNATVVDRNTIKALAEERIGKLSFRETFPGKYRKAEIRAAQESAVMLSEGNKEGAAVAKMSQVMNHYLGTAATNAKNDTIKIVDNMNRYNKKKVREEIQKSEGGYWDQIVTILNRFEFRKTATLKQVESLNLWAKQRMEEAGDGLVLSNAVLNESYVTHWKNVPYSDLQGISDSVKNIEHVARYSNKMTKMQEEIDFNKLKSNWVDNITKQDARFKNKNSRSRIDDARKSTKAEHIQRWISQLTKIPFLASWLDGGDRVGLSHDILVQPFTDALDSKIKLLDEVAAPVIKAIANRSKEDSKRHNSKIFIPEIDDNLSGDQIIAVALNTGNQGNLKKMLLGEKWADPENEADISFNNPKLQAVLKHMNRNDWELVQLIWDQMEKLYPQLAEVHRKTTGLVPPKVDSSPFVARVGGVAGEDINMRGGYYPVKYSPRRSHKAEKNAEKRDAETESMFNNTASIQSSVNTGATNERTGFYDKIFLSLDVVPDHFNETIHYITHHDAVRQVNRLIQAPDVADAITGALGEAEYKELKPWLNDIAKDGRQQPVKTFIDEAFQTLRFGTTLGVMGFKASTGIMQVFGLFTTAAELGIGPTLKGIRTVVGNSFYSKAILKTLGSRNDLQSGWDFAAERSKVLPHRAKTMDREIKNAMNRLAGKTSRLAAVQEASMKHIALIQTYIVDLPTWHAAYDKHLSENGDESLAVRFADTTVENIQGSGNVMNMARIMRNQSKIHSTFTMFMTFFSSLGNLTRDLVRGTKSGQYSMTSAAAKAMFLFTLPVFFEMLMRGELNDKDDGEDERMNKFLISSALYPLTSLPFIRDIASGALSDFGYNSTPVAAMMERGITSGKGLIENLFTDEEITKSQVKNTSKLAGAALGIPGLNQMWSTGEHLFDVIEEGEEFTTRELLFGPDRK